MKLLDLVSKMDSKLDVLDERLDSIDVRLAKYNAELEFHIARTNQIEDELAPIVKHVEQVRGASWVVAALVAAVSLLLAYLEWKR